MFGNQLRYEFRQLMRSHWLLSLAALLLILCLFAGYNGKQRTAQRAATLESALESESERYATARLLIDSLEAGQEVSVPSWQWPDQPQVVANSYPRVAAIPQAPLALVATGQSDLFSHYVEPTLRTPPYALSFAELASPIQLLFGTFDLAFVLIYLLPLVIIAFTYNMLSAEREQGSLRLLAAQPISIFSWLLQKSAIRFFLLAGMVVVALLLTLFIFGDPGAFQVAQVGQLLLLVLTYTLFWYTLSILINLTGKSSARNAATMVALWLGLVILVPSVVSQLANSLYPVPSRAGLVNDIRVETVGAGKEQDEVMDEYLRNHPELGGLNEEASRYWAQFLASQEIVTDRLQPTIDTYEQRLEKQQDWVHSLRFASPALLVQDGLNDVAQSSTRHYAAYRDQVASFWETWRGFFAQRIFQNQKITSSDLDALPAFEYQPPSGQQYFAANLIALLLFSGLLLMASVLAFRQKETYIL